LFRIAIELGVPVVPVAVTGLYDVLHKGSLIIRPGHEITVFVDEPIETRELGIEDIGHLRDRVRGVISAHVDAYFS
jgi:1-acyl-sn-glycerol-3-phosphate acyltransferase